MKKNISKYMLAIACIGMIGLGACEKKNYESIQQVDARKISSFISSNNLKMKLSDSDYYYQVVQNGTGKILKYSDSVAFFMTVKSLLGVTLYQGNSYSASETLLGYATPFTQVQQTLLGLNEGATVRVILPSHMAYGLAGSTSLGIGSNESLDIQVKTVSIIDRAKFQDSLIQKYIADKQITGMVKDENGIYVKINTKGRTDTIVNSVKSSITANYNLRILGFGTSIDAGITSGNLSGLIKAWELVLVGQGKGVSLRCIVPSRLGYGSGVNPKTGLAISSGIPSNSILDFDIIINEIVN